MLHLVILFFGWGMVVQCWNLIMGVSGIYSFGGCPVAVWRLDDRRVDQ
ncbi:MAG: hypothetical protein U0401_07480 [Anaerolineae bacterium]